MATEKKIRSAGGIGESKIFCAPEGSLGETAIDRLKKCHINGVEIAEMNLDPQVLSALDYYATEEGVAEKNARPNVREASGVELGKDGFSKALEQRKDDVKFRGLPLYESRDPLKEVADKFVPQGMRPKFLSGQRVREGGGTGDHEVVMYPPGHPQHGDPVKVRGMVLAQMPEEMAQARAAFYRGRGGQMLHQIEDKHRAEGGLVDD